ncbi:MAG TPA: protealysin inhibitor emfourin [Thermoanaerobaculia bacterium]|nr:protealysin inhibitor emfourin [Thermoanaerobaculia bacterium]
MRITIDRTGGFANIRRHREVDTGTLPKAEAEEIERLATEARKTPGLSAPMPDAFTYEITIDGVRYVVNEPAGAWEALIELLPDPAK